jgi:hypothetical protein
MTTELQITANQENSKLSTGAKTSEGKAIVAQNAIKHGLLSHKLILGEEDLDCWKILLNGLVETLLPVGMIEQLLVEKIAISFWRQRRLVGAEVAAIRISAITESKRLDLEIENIESDLYFVMDMNQRTEEVKNRLVSEFQEIKRFVQIKSTAPISDELLIRYSTGLDNELYKAITAFRKEQEIRLNNPLPAH